MVSENIKLSATSDEDLRVISAHLQDSITQIANIVHLKKKQNFFNKIQQIYVGRCRKRCF